MFRAVERSRANVLVVKRMLPVLAADPLARRMFEEEARISAFIHDENVVSFLGAGTNDGQPFIALEFVPGVDLWRLTRWITRRSQILDVDVALHVGLSILAGLAAIHSANDETGRSLGIVHRDVSPSNVLLSVDGDVKLGDLGIAWSQLREAAPVAPMNERAKGKLGYLAPEQVAGGEIDQRADVFSAAVVTAELLLGRPLFAAGSELGVLLAIRDGDIRPFTEIVSRLPDGLGDIIVRALAREPKDRIKSASTLRVLLEGYFSGDTSAAKKTLGELVKAAATAREDQGGALAVAVATPLQIDDRTPVDELQLEYAAEDAELTPLNLGGAELTPLRGVGEGPTTADVPTLQYHIVKANGEEEGPLPFAALVEAVATGKLGDHDRVKMPGGHVQFVSEFSSLARHLPMASQTGVPTKDREGIKRADATYTLAGGGVVRAFSVATLRDETGLLLCEHGGVRKEVYLSKGRPEYVASNLGGELLGEYLVGRNVITRGELDMALAVMPRFEGRLGDTLAALGLVEPVHLFRHIATQVREKLLDLFVWSGGSASLYRDVQPPQSGFPLDIDPWQVIEEGMRKRIAEGLDDDAFAAHGGARLERVVPPPSDVPILKLPADVQDVLGALSRPSTLADLSRHPTFKGRGIDLGAKPVVGLLLHLGLVRWTK